MGDQGAQQMQQPVVVYPNAYTTQNAYPSSSSSPAYSSSVSRGSFATVFIVVAVILVLSAVACIFGRLCNRISRGARQHHSKRPKREKGSSTKSHEIRPVEFEPRERGDLEFGMDMKHHREIEKPYGREFEPRERGDLEFKPYGRDYEDDMELGFDNKRGERGGGGPPQHGVRFKLPENEDGLHGQGEIRHGGPDFQFRPGH
ncbi:hypothetical protein Bca52824_032342 [Brassica carinata]|uniref:Transmembrane protein n=1 Tax=Brassica carinata TaxID=52824 RepID=A0A8X7V7G8_BRACI|nr:hypothetical protein Bca52824_032342 [Brassica carinata]